MNKGAQFLTVLAGLIALFSPAAAADAAPLVKSARSVCETGHRGQSAYDAKCLRTGTFKDARDMWRSIPVGRKGHESAAMEDRRSVCKFSGRLGGIRPAVREIFGDVAYDTFRNNGTVIKYAGAVATYDCLSMGYSVKF